MAIYNVDLVRGYLLQKLKQTKVYISCLSPTEIDALTALGQPDTVARMVDAILAELGQTSKNQFGEGRADSDDRRNRTLRKAKLVV